MKNFNLIKRLWTDSHEKQSPQRFGRYAAMLIMLLTLGVGQMWAIDFSGGYIYFDNSLGINSTTLQLCARQSSWTGVSSLTNISNTKLYYVADPQGSGWGGILGWVVISASPAKSNSNFDNWSSYTWCSDWNTYGFNSGSTYLIVPSSTSKSQSVTTSYYSGGYSGLNSTQTINTVVKIGSGSYSSANSKAEITITSYALTGNGSVTKQSTSISTSAKTQTVSAARTATTTLKVGTVASGYQFDGWYTAATGGTQLSSSTTYTYYPTAATTVYARFSEKMSTVTLTASPSEKGSFTIGGAAATSTTAGVTTTRSVTAVPIDGYHFVSWAITGGATISSTSTNPTTVTGGGAGTAATLTATFAADDVYTLTVAAGTGISAVTGTTNNIKAGDNIAITATVATGYTWSTWAKTGAGTLSTFTAGTKNQTVTVGTAGDITLTASATENKSSLTTSNHYDAGNPSYSVPSKSVSSIGITTQSTITAATPSTGYTFAGWTLSNNIVVVSGDKDNDLSLTIRTNGNGAAATAQANYEEVLTQSTWVLKGGSAFGGSAWSTEHALTKKTGHSTESVVYHTFDIASTNTGDYNANFNFKLVKKGDSDTWFGIATDSHASEWWYNRNAGEQTMSTGGGDHDNVQLRADVAGPYEIKVDYSTPASPKVTVTFPTSYTLTYSIGSVAGNDGSISTSPTTASGSKVLSGNTVTLTAPAAKAGYTWKGWYTNAAGTEGKIPDTDRAITVTMNADKTLYACYTINNHAITHSASSHGSYTIQVGSAAAVSTNTTSDYGKTITLAATPATGYHFGSWSAYKTGTPATTITVTSNQFTMPDYAVTVGATFSPNTYRVQFHRNGGAGDVVYQNFTYDVAQNLTANSYTRTGYTFAGWALTTGGDVTYADEEEVSNLTSDNGVDFHLYAKWTANPYTVTLDVDEDHKGSTAGATTSHTVYYNTVTTNIPNLPTAENYYGLDGYYTDQNGAGTKLINGDGTWIASVEGYTDEDKKWIHDGDVTLYAYYKASEITDLTLSPASIAPNGTVTATPNISPLPQGTTCVCWKFLRNNGNPYPGVTFSSNPSSENTAVTFTTPSVSGTYKVACILRTGSTCGSGTVLDSIVANLVVAGEHTVTIQYQDGDGRALKDTIHTIGKPLEWSSSTISPATITGYTFARWEAGDGVFITDDGGTTTKTTTTTADIKIKANYEGTLTAVYTKKRMIYFYNTLGWGSVYVYFYKNDSYWQTVSPFNGSGANTSYTWTNTPYSEGLHGQMLPVSEGSNIYYFDAEAAGVNASYDDVVFTEHQQHGYNYFYETNAARRGDYKSSMPMFVPLADQTAEVHNRTNYYNSGYWMNYPENSGYTLKIYNDAYATKETAAVQSIAFPYSDDLKLPLKIDVELSDGYNHDYWFMVYRNDGTYMGGGYHFKQGYQDEQIITGGNSKEKITTSAPGNYTFILTYHGNGSGTNNYYIDVDFPIATGDYRIYYSDNATWSKGAHTKDSWHHPSHSIAKATDAKNDTVSFFIPKGVGILHTMKFQKASVTNEGVVTWADVAGGGITIPSSVEESGVYNFIVSQPAGGASIALEKVEPYTGNFYIRTDCAGNTKWDSFKNADHQMTYSDYAEANSGFSHYYAHWVTSGMNVKFVIANDYSMCISDTLIEDSGTTIADISNIGVLNSGNASIRFMWNQATNKISRAYISGSSNVADRFLVLEGDAKLYDENGNHYSISGLSPNEVNLIDDENFVYERTIQVNATACAKLTAKYNNNVQYFKGGSGSTASDSVQLLGGTYNVDKKYPMRIVYDFKTNRLVTAYMPEGEISGEVAINADMMLIREHQGEATQLTFANGESRLTEVKTVYGVMRFNRWTLNNRQHPEDMNKDHSKTNDSISTYHPYVDPGDVKSVSERGLYWISFPFDVKLSDVFGLGTYGEHWIMMEYDGAARAKEGYWKDSEGFWEYIWNRNGVTLEKGKGYVLALELDLMQADNRTFWSNEIQQVELFFPSASSTTGSISQANVDVTVPSHLCTIDRRTDKSVADWNKDRRVADSHWNIIGVPSYANYNKTLTDGSSTITWNDDPQTDDLPFLYEWNASDNTYTVQSGTTYPFKAMHAYYVQYAGTLHWTLASATPSSIVARRTYADKPQNVEFQLQLQQNEKMIDQTFVKLSNDETASVNFSFGEDLNKEFNSGKANIYTFIENYIPAAGNTLPLTEQTTVVPMGVKIATNGDYTFSIPSGTNGVGVTLVDNETGIRTNLALMDYTITLEAGTQDDRFYLEISPIKHVATGIEEITGDGSQVTGARKVMVDGILYIIKDGKVFSTQGARVK